MKFTRPSSNSLEGGSRLLWDYYWPISNPISLRNYSIGPIIPQPFSYYNISHPVNRCLFLPDYLQVQTRYSGYRSVVWCSDASSELVLSRIPSPLIPESSSDYGKYDRKFGQSCSYYWHTFPFSVLKSRRLLSRKSLKSHRLIKSGFRKLYLFFSMPEYVKVDGYRNSHKARLFAPKTKNLQKRSLSWCYNMGLQDLLDKNPKYRSISPCSILEYGQSFFTGFFECSFSIFGSFDYENDTASFGPASNECCITIMEGLSRLGVFPTLDKAKNDYHIKSNNILYFSSGDVSQLSKLNVFPFFMISRQFIKKDSSYIKIERIKRSSDIYFSPILLSPLKAQFYGISI